ncbi:hypothetical protein E2C01_087454 [Portunus trituberculatus]|uniref:Uncharacterized protein n=1 Tax=Portunus trituberculatus TaxID=210409 RepID=A0A5B7JHB7_PORTR|nr:hypothetical protein [Portunus trituberculatus]
MGQLQHDTGAVQVMRPDTLPGTKKINDLLLKKEAAGSNNKIDRGTHSCMESLCGSPVLKRHRRPGFHVPRPHSGKT